MTMSASRKSKKNHINLIILRVIFLLFAAMMLLVDLMMVCTQPGRESAVASIVVLDAPTPLPENEGKLVLVQGTYTTQEYAYDELFGLTFDSPLAARYKECFNKIGRRVVRYDWEEMGDPVMCVGKATLGDFAVEGALLSVTPTELVALHYGDALPDDVFTVTEGGLTYLSFDDIRPVTSTGNLSEISQWKDYRRYYYELADPAATYTVVGVQINGKLCLSEEMDDDSILVGTADKADFLSEIRKEFWMTVGICTGIGLVCGFFSLKGVLFLKKKPKNEDECRSDIADEPS